MRFTPTILLSLGLAACGGGGGDGDSPPASQSPPPAPNQSVGGIWEGTDLDGEAVIGLVTEAGAFHFIDPYGQGFGTATVTGSQVSASYTYVADLGTTLVDGSTGASCTLTGTVVERVSLTVNTLCTTTGGTTGQNTAALSFNALYHRDATLATIAGNFNDYGDVLNINSGGVLFEQDADDGCILNGQITVVNAAYNAYLVQFTVSNCNANYAALNATSWTGIATLDNTTSPEELVFGVVGNITFSGVVGTYSLIGVAPRI